MGMLPQEKKQIWQGLIRKIWVSIQHNILTVHYNLGLVTHHSQKKVFKNRQTQRKKIIGFDSA